jgi:hypothetical protein
MIRLFGFLLGSALSVGAFLLLLGPPEFRSMTTAPPLPAATETAPITEAAAPATAEPNTALTAEPTTPAPSPERELEALADAEPVALPQETDVEPRWHSFWSPFASRIAANGFVSRLEAVTGYDYRVVKVETGVYEVALTYTHDDELRDKLAVIASATGLELPDS